MRPTALFLLGRPFCGVLDPPVSIPLRRVAYAVASPPLPPSVWKGGWGPFYRPPLPCVAFVVLAAVALSSTPSTHLPTTPSVPYVWHWGAAGRLRVHVGRHSRTAIVTDAAVCGPQWKKREERVSTAPTAPRLPSPVHPDDEADVHAAPEATSKKERWWPVVGKWGTAARLKDECVGRHTRKTHDGGVGGAAVGEGTGCRRATHRPATRHCRRARTTVHAAKRWPFPWLRKWAVAVLLLLHSYTAPHGHSDTSEKGTGCSGEAETTRRKHTTMKRKKKKKKSVRRVEKMARQHEREWQGTERRDVPP